MLASHIATLPLGFVFFSANHMNLHGETTPIIHVTVAWFCNIISSTIQASARVMLLMLLLTPLFCHVVRTTAKMCIQRIISLSVSPTKGAEGGSHHSLRFISPLLIPFQQSNQLYAVVKYMFPVT